LKDDAKKIFRGIVIYTKGEEKRDFAVLVDGDRIIDVEEFSILKEQFPFVQLLDVPGYFYPAFFDSHVHLVELSNVMSSVDARNFKGYDDLIDILKSKQDEPFYIYNLDFNNLTIGQWEKLFNLPLKIFIQSIDEHSVFVSRVFLERAMIKIREVEGGVLVKKKGNFIGIFKDRAIELVNFIKEREISPESIERSFNYLLKRGITSVVNFDFSIYSLLEKLKRNGLKIRIVQSIKKESLKDIVTGNVRTNDGDVFLKFGPLKCFMDGSLGSKTAYMKNDFPFKGVLTMNIEELNWIIQFANSHGIQVAVHAIGSGAVHIVLEALFKYGNTQMRNRIEHLQFIDIEDLALLEKTSFIASMQPIHATSDFPIFKRIMGDYKLAYPWNTVLKANKMLTFGSDVPVDDASPVLGINAAVMRTPENMNESFQKEECISVSEALDAYTKGSSYASFSEDYIGEIKKGNLADFAILKKSLFSDNINNSVLGTIVGGKLGWMK